jgi:thiamine pyrophosphokinase
LLYYVRLKNIIPRIISEKEQLYIAVNEEVIINGNKGDTISVIPTNGNAKGVTLTNLEYPLNNYDMKFYLPLGISNVMLNKECKIKVNDGSLIIIRNT